MYDNNLFNFLFKNFSYDCSMFNATTLRGHDTTKIVIGFWYIILASFFLIIYFPFVIAMFQLFKKHSIYKLLLAIGIGDIINLVIAGIASGYFMIEGNMYCSHPTLIFILGAFAFSLWVFNDVLTLVLAISRSFYMLSPTMAEDLFGGNKTYLWLIPPTIIWLWTFLFTPPVIFSTILTSWVFQPYAGFAEAEKHDIINIYHTINNYFVCASQISLYSLVIIINLYLSKSRLIQVNGKNAKLTGIGLFFQSASICAITVTTAVLYVIGESVPVPDWFITTAHTFWILTHGFPGIIFLIANKTLKNTIKSWRINKSSNATITMVQPLKSNTTRQ